MHFTRILLCLSLCCIGLQLMADPNKQALKFIKEGAYEKAENQLQKSLSKDTLNPGGHYLFSLLYRQDAYVEFNLDSSYFHIRKAESQWANIEEKEKSKLLKITIDQDAILTLRSEIEYLAYLTTRRKMTLEAFDDYYLRFDNDSLKTLIYLTKDSLAYTFAQSENTWQSFLKFSKEYAHSSQAPEAIENYHELIYLEKAKGQRLSSLEQFLEEVPDTPYRDQIELRILFFYVRTNDPSEYLRFVENYPNSIHLPYVGDLLFHVSDLLDSPYPASLMVDSLKEEISVSQELAFPYLKDGKYGFYAINGKELLPAVYDEISNQLKCQVFDGLLLPISRDGNNMLISKNGTNVIQGFTSFRPMNQSVYELTRKGKKGVILANGTPLLAAEYDRVELIGDRFFLAEKNNSKRLFSFLGLDLLPYPVDGVRYLPEVEGLLLEKNGKLGIVSLRQIGKKDFDGGSVDFLFEEVELLDKGYLLCFVGQEEALYDSELEQIIPLGGFEIYVEDDYIYAESEWGIQLFDTSTSSLGEEFYQDLILGEGRIAVKKRDRWNLFFDGLTNEPITGIDSLFFLSESATLVVNSAKRTLFFRNGNTVDLLSDEKVSVVPNTLDKVKTTLLLIKGSDDEIALYDEIGEILWKNRGANVNMLSDSLFVLQDEKGSKLIDRNGDLVLKKSYDLIEPDLQNGDLALHLLKDGQLGIYHHPQKNLLGTEFDEKLKMVNDTIFIGKRDGETFLVNLNQKKDEYLVFQDIKVLSERFLLVQKEDEWELLDIVNSQVLVSNILQLEEGFRYSGFRQIKYIKESGIGLLDSRKGVFLPAIYNEIFNMGSESEPFFYVERYLNDSDFYIISYVDQEGEKVVSKAYQEAEHAKIFCEN